MWNTNTPDTHFSIRFVLTTSFPENGLGKSQLSKAVLYANACLRVWDRRDIAWEEPIACILAVKYSHSHGVVVVLTDSVEPGFGKDIPRGRFEVGWLSWSRTRWVGKGCE